MKAYLTTTDSGIYCILNIINSKIYIGSSNNMRNRTRTHLHKLKLNSHYNKYFQSSYNKYGKESFYCFIIEKCKESELISKEEYWINLLKADYNILTKELHRFAAYFPTELRNQITESLKQAYKNGLQNSNKKKVYVYNLKGEFIKEFSCAAECCKELNITKSTLGRWLNVGKGQSQEYQFRYEYFESIPEIYKPVLHTEEHKRKISETLKNRNKIKQTIKI